MAKMRVIAYLRVSTVGQVTDGFGLPTQERLVRDWCRREGCRLVRVVSENGRSGTLSDEERPGLFEVLGALRAKEADAIIVTSLDRLARVLTVQEAVLAKAWTFGGQVFTVDGGEVLRDDPDDPMRTAMRQMAGVFAELDRKLVVKRLRNGKATKAAAGGYIGGAPPLGYRAEAGALVLDPDEAEVVAVIVGLRRDGASYREICAALDEAGHRPRRGGRWQPMVVRRIVQRVEACLVE